MSGVSQNTIGRWRRTWPAIPIAWQPMHTPSYVSVAHRKSVAVLDALGCAKE